MLCCCSAGRCGWVVIIVDVDDDDYIIIILIIDDCLLLDFLHGLVMDIAGMIMGIVTFEAGAETKRYEYAVCDLRFLVKNRLLWNGLPRQLLRQRRVYHNGFVSGKRVHRRSGELGQAAVKPGAVPLIFH